MFLHMVIFLGILTAIFRGVSILGFFLSLEILYFIFIFFLAYKSNFLGYMWGLVLVVGVSVLMLTTLISALSFFGSDSQSVFLD